MLYVLCHKYQLFHRFKQEEVSKMQLSAINLSDNDVFPLCFLEWLLESEDETIDQLLSEVITSLKSIHKRNMWFGFLPSIFAT